VRIVAGSLRGRTLIGPKTETIRPTSDRVRGAIFNILTHAETGVAIDAARVLDLFAGTGALGLEALSRGAAFCLFVEKSAPARALIERNIDALGLGNRAEVRAADVMKLGPAPRAAFTLAFLDPPYGQDLAATALAVVAKGGWLAPGALAVIEERSGVAIDWPEGFEVMDVRRWGDTQALFARYRGA
jgi:16S rRNA (guanine966-N2)-methyltransferase